MSSVQERMSAFSHLVLATLGSHSTEIQNNTLQSNLCHDPSVDLPSVVLAAPPCHSYKPSPLHYRDCPPHQPCVCGSSSSLCSKRGYEDQVQYSGCINKHHAHLCCQVEDISFQLTKSNVSSRHQGDSSYSSWLQSTSPFLPDLPASSSLSTCLRREEVWLGAAASFTRNNLVECRDRSFVHCRSRTDQGLTVNICQSVSARCNGLCFKGEVSSGDP